MDEHLLEIRYLVDDLGDFEIDEELERPLRMACFEYLLRIQLIHPYDSYCVKLKRGTALMSFAWSDNDHITSDIELRSALMKLVTLIEDLQPIDYESFGFERPMKL